MDGSEPLVLPEGTTCNKIAETVQNHDSRLHVNEQVRPGNLHFSEIVGNSQIHPGGIQISAILTTNETNPPGPQINSILRKHESKGTIIGSLGGGGTLERAMAMASEQTIYQTGMDFSDDGGDQRAGYAFANEAIREITTGNPKQVLFDIKEDVTLANTSLAVEGGNCERAGMRLRNNTTLYGSTNNYVEKSPNGFSTTGMRTDGDCVNYGTCTNTIHM